MSYFDDAFQMKTESKTPSDFIVTKGNVRISVLTPCLVRLEKSENGNFTDEPTQSVWYRAFDKPEFSFAEKDGLFTVRTAQTVFEIDASSGKMRAVTLKDGNRVTDFNKGNLLGTYRTLDNSIGKVKIGSGIISKSGVAYFDDGKSLILKENGEIAPRKSKGTDIYYFAYGHSYRRAISDFYRLTGDTPLLPRFCLGNWWSRYKAYTQDEYEGLMQRFIDEEIPISVATVDMDWHWTDVEKRFGKEAKRQTPAKNIIQQLYSGGWTGYSWNTELFPDYRGFLKWLQDRNFKVTLNVHPSDGIRFFETQYKDMAENMGVDPATKEEIPFDVTNPKFVENYFICVHHPYESEGVDFWWIDWQQGNTSNLKGLDPLWALNHYHSLDMKYRSLRPIILSRYAGIGSHRYPLGFSGDAMVCWKVLDFQPYFTLTAANVGYSWWSHDIGGHHLGYKDDELYIRWVQFGTFSPIMRLHSTSNEFMGKEPWKYSFTADILCRETMRLRHRMIPYLYTMNYLTHRDGRALCEPMYYSYPEENEAYSVKNEYSFGTELIVCPVTEKCDKKTNFAKTSVFLPKGHRYTDIFTGYIYEGGQMFNAYRGIESIPVFARDGSIIPLDRNDRTNFSGNPADMEILVYRGNNSFTLYEDDGISTEFENGKFALTRFTVAEEQNEVRFVVAPVEGDASATVQSRNYLFSFKDITAFGSAAVTINGREIQPKITDKKYVSVEIENVKPTDSVEISFKNITAKENPAKKDIINERVSRLQTGNVPKKTIYTGFFENPDEGRIPGCARYKGLLSEAFRMK